MTETSSEIEKVNLPKNLNYYSESTMIFTCLKYVYGNSFNIDAAYDGYLISKERNSDYDGHFVFGNKEYRYFIEKNNKTNVYSLTVFVFINNKSILKWRFKMSVKDQVLQIEIKDRPSQKDLDREKSLTSTSKEA